MKFPVVFAMFFIASVVNAQRSATVFLPSANDSHSSASVRNVIDTLVPSSFIPVNEGGLGCFTGYYNSPDSGYVSGNNQYGDLEKAQFYSLTQAGYAKVGTIQGVLVHFAYKTVGPQPENIVVKIYDVDTSGFQPKNLIGISNAVEINSIKTDGSSTEFSFPVPVPVTDSFFVSVELPLISGDTLVILSTVDGCVSNTGSSWEMWENETWHMMLYSWVLNIDLAVFPIVDVQNEVGISEPGGGNDEDYPVFPNPASEELNLQWKNSSAQNISIDLLDQFGKIRWRKMNFDTFSSGRMEIPVSNLESGIYSLRIQANDKIEIHKVAIVH